MAAYTAQTRDALHRRSLVLWNLVRRNRRLASAGRPVEGRCVAKITFALVGCVRATTTHIWSCGLARFRTPVSHIGSRWVRIPPAPLVWPYGAIVAQETFTLQTSGQNRVGSINWGVAQPEEQRVLIPQVVGSSPTTPLCGRSLVGKVLGRHPGDEGSSPSVRSRTNFLVTLYYVEIGGSYERSKGSRVESKVFEIEN